MAEEIVLKCPFCGDHPHHNHLYVSLELKLFHCWYCGKGGRLDYLLRRFPFMQEMLHLAPLTKFKKTESAAAIFIPLTQVRRRTEAGPYIRYLVGRGMTVGEIRDCKVSISPQICGRAIFPHRVGGALRFWTGRAISKFTSPKWLFPRQGTTTLDKSKVVWNLEHLMARGETTIWICEGIFDAIACNGVAVFGKAPSAAQLRLILSTRPHRLVIGLDRDAECEARQLQTELRSIVPTQVRLPELYDDYGEFLKHRIRRRIGRDDFEPFKETRP